METSSFSEFITSSTATIIAIVALLGGIATILRYIKEIIELISKIKEVISDAIRKKSVTPSPENKVLRRKVNYKPLLVGLILFSISGSIFMYQNKVEKSIPLNQRLTKEAWEFYNDKDYSSSIERANECIKKFRGQAELKQEELVRKETPQPNSNPNEREKTVIFSRGLLNDVATCYFIKGICYLELDQREDAITSLLRAKYFTYAMCWDNAGFFFNISEAAAGKLRELEYR